jgi:hypothetical protein
VETDVTTRVSELSVLAKRGRRLHGLALVSLLAALMLTLLLEALDQTMVGTALPRIIGQYRTLYFTISDEHTLAWSNIILRAFRELH